MRKHSAFLPLIIIVALLTLIAYTAQCQSTIVEDQVTFADRNLSGPRLGVTVVTGSGKLADALREHGFGRMMSQFGWHFEYQVLPVGGGPQFVIQFVPLVGGVEYSKFIPSATLAIGVRLPDGIEFGMGPNVVISEKPSSALTIAVGKSFNYGGVSIPVNIAMTSNPDGQRVSLIIGYAIRGGAKTQW